MSLQEERAAIEREIDGQTVCDSLLANAERYPEMPAYSDWVDDSWQTLTWGAFRRQILELAAGLVALGMEPGDRVGLMMSNRSEHVLADMAAVHAGGTATTLYATLAPNQVAYIATNAEIRFAVLEGKDQLDRWQPVLSDLPALRKVIVLDAAACPADDMFMTWTDFVALGTEHYAAHSAEVDRRWRAVTPGDALTVLYTSGTTGNPKGVIITHAMAQYEAVTSVKHFEIQMHPLGVSYLPFAHIADRVLSLYIPINRASHIHFCAEIPRLGEVLGRVRPHGFFGVPRVWEKIMARLQAALAAEPDEQRRAAVAQAMDVGLRYVESRQYGREPTPDLAAAYERADASVLSPIRSLMGLDRAVYVAAGAAPLPLEVSRFFAGLGLPICDVFGLTETTGAVSLNRPSAYRLGTVGQPAAGVELRIADDGEILVRGRTNTPGYLGLPEATAELLDADGWLHTGDIGAIDEDGFLSIVDRKKELIITAGGENIAPSMIENYLKEHPLVGQALAYGDKRPYVTAIISLDGEVAPVWAKERGIEATGLAGLAEHEAVRKEIGTAVDAANQRLARAQQVKRWRLVPVEWTAESEELTPTLKLRRRVIHTKYADLIDGMYAAGDNGNG
jgi:long-chain acyl-CoA synthetase